MFVFPSKEACSGSDTNGGNNGLSACPGCSQIAGPPTVRSWTPRTFAHTFYGNGSWRVKSGTGYFVIKIKEAEGAHLEKDEKSGALALAIDQVNVRIIYLDQPLRGGPDYMYGTPEQNHTIDKTTVPGVPGVSMGLQGQNLGGDYLVQVATPPEQGSPTVVVTTTE